MKRLLTILAATALSAPALAQHHGHHPPGHTMPAPKAKPKPAAKPAARKPTAKPKPAARKTAAKPKAAARPAAKVKPKAAPKAAVRKAAPKPAPKPAGDPHAGHDMPAVPAQQPDPHAGHTMPVDPHAGHNMPQSADPHAGHNMPEAADPHAGHDMGTAQPAPPVAAPPAAAFVGPAHAADLVYAPAAMARARAGMREEHGSMETYKFLVDQLEAKIGRGRDGFAWDGQAWYGGDIDKLWVKSEGEGEFGRAPETAEVQALWSRAIDPWFDVQAGLRYDFRPDPERVYLVLGVQGLAPYWFEVDAAAFVSNKGDVSARVEAEYDLRLTQKLILQPRVEFDLALQDVPEIGVGSGLSTGEIGARLRYEIRPEFAPYVGIEYERAFGDTAAFRRSAGEERGGFSLLVGLRTWF
jgi:copper resistance protein B